MTNLGVVPLAPGIIGLSRLVSHFAAGTVLSILTIAQNCERLCAGFGEHGDEQSNHRTLITLAELGDEASAGKLFTLLYRELHRLAERQLARQGDVSVSATTLIHEPYLDMSGQEGQTFPDRGRFMAYAAKVMRGLIIDHVRSRLAIKRGGAFELMSLTPTLEMQSLMMRTLPRSAKLSMRWRKSMAHYPRLLT